MSTGTTPQWRITEDNGVGGTHDCYPQMDDDPTTPTYKRIGRPMLVVGEVELKSK